MKDRARSKIRICHVCAATLLLAILSLSAAQAAPRLQVSPNHHFLVQEDGSPFFYLGDTAWELFHRLKREEADLYLSNRVDKGFSVIQAVVLAEFDGLKTPNAYGQLPFEQLDPARPNEAYFEQVDYVVRKAGQLGLYVGMLPTWGDKVNKKWGAGPEIFSRPEIARAYGEFLGKRYQDQAIIWILGGDRNPENETYLAVWRALAEGLRKGDGGAHLITYHPMGGSASSKWFQQDAWLDFNTFQSGHAQPDAPNFAYTTADYQVTPTKPTLDSEPRYEDHPINWDPKRGWFNDFDVRQAAYWSLLAGACGHTYGNHNVWQFWQADRKAISSARTPWKEALDHPGAFQMGHARRLFESRPYQKLVPDPTILANDTTKGADNLQAARAEDGSFLFVYAPTGRPATVKLDKISGEKINAFWFDPRVGTAVPMGEFPTRGTQTFEPFSRGRGQDWVLVLDDASQAFSKPGAPRKP